MFGHVCHDSSYEHVQKQLSYMMFIQRQTQVWTTRSAHLQPGCTSNQEQRTCSCCIAACATSRLSTSTNPNPALRTSSLPLPLPLAAGALRLATRALSSRPPSEEITWVTCHGKGSGMQSKPSKGGHAICVLQLANISHSVTNQHASRAGIAAGNQCSICLTLSKCLLSAASVVAKARFLT